MNETNSIDPYDQTINGEGKIKRIHLMFIDETKRLCDSCNQTKKCGIFDIPWARQTFVICSDCLHIFSEEIK